MISPLSQTILGIAGFYRNNSAAGPHSNSWRLHNNIRTRKHQPEPASDIWYEWLLSHRNGGDAEYGECVRVAVEAFADKVLDGAALDSGSTLVDVGSGTGLVAFRAISRMGPGLKVVVTDISRPLLDYAREEATRLGIQNQCTFLVCPADDLGQIEDCSVDAIVTRSSLAYVSDKTAALKEFLRVMKPGGRLSIGEPVFQDEAFYVRALRAQVEKSMDPHDLFLRLLHRWKASQFPDTEEQYAVSPHVNYSERDLLNWVYGAGFTNIHMELHIDISQTPPTSWEAFLNSSPHPLAPTLKSVMDEKFSDSERLLFEKVLRPSVEKGGATNADRMVYITARKSDSI